RGAGRLRCLRQAAHGQRGASPRASPQRWRRRRWLPRWGGSARPEVLMADDEEYIRMRGTVKRVLRSATFLVELDGGLEVTARPSGKMRKGRMIRILPG